VAWVRKLGWIVAGIVLVGVVVATFVLYPGEPERHPPEPPSVTAFAALEVPFVHRWTPEASHGFLGAAAIDIDGDGVMEVFLGGGHQQQDALLTYRDGQLVDRIEGTGLSDVSATYGATSIDIDDDGDTDLLVGRASGITLYLNADGVFAPHPIDARLPADTDPLAISLADYDGDGDADLYVSGFISAPAFVGRTFNDPAVVRPNRLLRNDGFEAGVLHLTDVTDAAGVAGHSNTFQTAWVDLDLDSDPDLVTAPNAGRIELLRNDGDGTFTELASPGAFGFWMCVAVGDIDNDGDQDLFFTNAGRVVPKFMLRGDLRDDQPLSVEWLLLRNDGDFQFTDVTEPYGLTGYGFAWGASFADLDADGFLDLLVSMNAEKIFTHALTFMLPSSKAMLSRPNGRGGRSLYDTPQLEIGHPDYGMAPLLVDLDDDGALDVVMPNQNQRARAHLSRDGGRRLTVVLPDTAQAVGARVTVHTTEGPSTTQEVIRGVGLLSDHSPHLVFGLGPSADVVRVHVRWRTGTATNVPASEIVEGRLELTPP
jgi:hypothetical protein